MDLSVYLVTGRSLLPPGKNYYESLEESLQGGVTIVQIREKDADTSEFLEIARKSKAICDKYGVPMLINDRVDIALAVNAAGVHVGQKDMPLVLARKLLPDGSIIGVSCNNIEHVKRSLLEGADYIGISPIWPTSTKTDADPAVGVRGVPPLLELLEGQTMKAVAIGMYWTRHTFQFVVIKRNDRWNQMQKPSQTYSIAQLLQRAVPWMELLSFLRSTLVPHSPTHNLNYLWGQITNTVTLPKISGALLVNIGTIQAEQLKGMLKAGYYANFYKKPIVLDPVGVGASQFRMESIQALLSEWQPSVIKGNAAELSALAGSLEVASKGVDSEGPGFKDPVTLVRSLAQRESRMCHRANWADRLHRLPAA
ncbi:thiamine monophosphate synthase/TENI-domain-containing protein [Flagelloscypha sp. PMI_526]|nr:thiamine monophosphate synthase/TENI-domain-containing protein [Flagelloscypha sp. PMI_526]